jgi:hypothetical protein
MSYKRVVRLQRFYGNRAGGRENALAVARYVTEL